MKTWRWFWSGVLIGCLLLGGLHLAAPEQPDTLHVKILAFNDFHGHLARDRRRDRGGAAVLAAYLKAAARGMEGRTFIVQAGDQVGAAPAASTLLQHEPAIMFLNLLAEQQHPSYNLIGTLGNHEFDQGTKEMLRLIYGGNHIEGPFLEDPYGGAKFPYVCANVVDRETGRPLLPPFVIKKAVGVPLAFIGAVTTETPDKVDKTMISGLLFVDEAEAINYQVKLLKLLGVRAIVVLLHAGGRQDPYDGPTVDPPPQQLTGKIVEIVSRLDDEVDVVVSGHTHEFTNALVKTNNPKKKILVTQAVCHGEAYADIDLELDPKTKDVAAKRAQIKPTLATAGPGLHPDPEVSKLVDQAAAKIKQQRGIDINQRVGEAQRDIDQEALGKLVAAAYRAAGRTQFALVNPGGVRADKIAAGPITWGDLFEVQPFQNDLVKITLTGKEVYALLNQQWAGRASPKILYVSGLRYTVDEQGNQPQILQILDSNNQPVKNNETTNYSVTVNSYLADGNDNFSIMSHNKQARVKVGKSDLQALIDYVALNLK